MNRWTSPRTLRAAAASCLAALAAASCKSAGSSQAPDDVHEGTAAAAPGDVASQRSAVRALMAGHDLRGASMRDAVERGDLDRARAEAQALAHLGIRSPFDPTWSRRLDAMTTAASSVAAAHDLEAASRGTAQVARTCGECHASLGRPRPMVGQLEEQQQPGVRAAMQRHHRAAEQLWDGLVLPSNAAWQAGAAGLSEAPLVPEQLTPGKSPVPRVGELAERVHALGRVASSIDQAEARTELYGRVLGSCAECHAWLGGGPGPLGPQ